MKLWLVQLDVKVADVAHNARRIEEFIERAAEAKADLVAFGEMALSGYVCGTDFLELAEPVPGPSTEAIMAKARRHNIYVVFGMPERRESILHNSAVAFGPEGLVGVYRKLYLPGFHLGEVKYEEPLFFKPGSEIVTFDTAFGKIGIEICYDMWWPEIPRACALKGAWLMINISAASLGIPCYFEKSLPTEGMLSQMWYAYVNSVGTQRGVTFGGGNFISDHMGEVKKRASVDENAVEEVLEYEVDREEVMKWRLQLPMIRDTRPEVWRMAAEAAADLAGVPLSWCQRRTREA